MYRALDIAGLILQRHLAVLDLLKVHYSNLYLSDENHSAYQ